VVRFLRRPRSERSIFSLAASSGRKCGAAPPLAEGYGVTYDLQQAKVCAEADQLAGNVADLAGRPSSRPSRGAADNQKRLTRPYFLIR
ncbi:MAG: hypothetical protein KDI64_09355, partial [Candidatus Accumulibacter sp.]|nr:hypothetical protein [Accumulibacter sp.]